LRTFSSMRKCRSKCTRMQLSSFPRFSSMMSCVSPSWTSASCRRSCVYSRYPAAAPRSTSHHNRAPGGYRVARTWPEAAPAHAQPVPRPGQEPDAGGARACRRALAVPDRRVLRALPQPRVPRRPARAPSTYARSSAARAHPPRACSLSTARRAGNTCSSRSSTCASTSPRPQCGPPPRPRSRRPSLSCIDALDNCPCTEA